jgi:group I intron endonuclease
LNGKFYIGSTKDFERRKREHLCSKENYPFQEDLRKNPEAFVWEVYVDDLDTNEHEVRLLKKFFFDVRCYNINPCAERPPNVTGRKRWKNELTQEQKLCFEKPEGEGWEKGMLQKTIERGQAARLGIPRTKETKKKIGEANTGKISTEEFKKRISESRTGKTSSEETKKKLSGLRIGKKNHQFGITGALNPRSKAIMVIKPDGTELHFGGMCEAARELGIPQSTLCGKYLKPGNVLKKGKFKGWQFLFKNSENF